MYKTHPFNPVQELGDDVVLMAGDYVAATDHIEHEPAF